MKLDKALGKHMSTFRALNAALTADTRIATEKLVCLLSTQPDTKEDVETAAFWIRTVVRTLLAQVEGISFWMRNAVLEMADAAGLQITNRTRAELSELKYDRSSDTIIPELASKGTKETLKLAFRYFPLLFGSNWKLNTNDPGWADFLVILEERKRIAHPCRIEYFYPAHVGPHLMPGMLWFFSSTMEMMDSCLASLGLPPQGKREELNPKPFRSLAIAPIDPDPGFYSKVEEYESTSLAYVNEVFRLVHADTVKSLDILKESVPTRSIPLPPYTAFAARNTARALLSGLEGMTAAFIFFILAAVKRHEIELTDQENNLLRSTNEEARAAHASTLFSRFFGYGQQARTDGDSWRALKIARNFRNRITHPRSIADLEVKMGTIQSVTKALAWYTDEFYVEINVERTANLQKDISIEEIFSGLDLNRSL
jgi:hypothetical protein